MALSIFRPKFIELLQRLGNTTKNKQSLDRPALRDMGANASAWALFRFDWAWPIDHQSEHTCCRGMQRVEYVRRAGIAARPENFYLLHKIVNSLTGLCFHG